MGSSAFFTFSTISDGSLAAAVGMGFLPSEENVTAGGGDMFGGNWKGIVGCAPVPFAKPLAGVVTFREALVWESGKNLTMVGSTSNSLGCSTKENQKNIIHAFITRVYLPGTHKCVVKLPPMVLISTSFMANFFFPFCFAAGFAAFSQECVTQIYLSIQSLPSFRPA